MQQFGTLRQELQQREISVNKLALMSGIASSSLYAAMAGNVRFWPGWKKKIAAALEMEVRELFPEEEEVRNEH